MKKWLSFVLVAILLVSLMAGCTGTTVVIGNCTCPTDGGDTPNIPDGTGLKTGLAILGDLSGSANAGEKDGQAAFDVTVAAVTVDDNGVIRSCIIDSVPANVTFDAKGNITSDLAAQIATKNELGENYGMKAYGGAKYEWNEQVAALSQYAVGKTVEQLHKGAVNESGKASDVDLAATATITLKGYVEAVEAAVASARHMGAKVGDELKLAILSTVKNSTSVTGETAGNAQLDCDVTALTVSGESISSCVIDSLQAKIQFDGTGVITSDVSAAPQTKNQLGEAYGMKAWAGAKYEWNEQAASFAAYVTGKTAAEVAGIAVNEKKAPSDADLAATVTIAVVGFQDLIAKAFS